MSPILSLRNQQTFNFGEDEESVQQMAPAFRMHSAPAARAPYTSRVGHAQLLRKRPMNGSAQAQRRHRVLATVKRRAKAISRKLPSVKDVNKIDQYSRMFFPSLFIVFNVCYWSYYLLQ